MSVIRIIVIDENRLLDYGIQAIISEQSDLQIVGVARSFDQGWRIGGELVPDLFIVEVAAVVPAVVQVVARLADLGQTAIPCVLLTSDSGRHEAELLRLRASIVSTRTLSASNLVALIRLVAAGHVVIEQQLADQLIKLLIRRELDAQVLGSRVGELTARQREVFDLIACGMSNAEIARALSVAESTVKSHVKSIFGTLGLRNRVEAAICARGYRSDSST